VNTSSTVSIAMAVCNGQRFIQEQLDSFVRQSRPPDELVVSDNASTDRTVEIVREFAATVPFPVRLFVNDYNLGVTKNFERAIKESTGDLIFLSDCDDVWNPEKIAVMEQFLASDPKIAIALCDAEIVDEALNPSGHTIWHCCGFLPTPETVKKIAEIGPIDRSFAAFGNCMAFRATIKPLIVPLPDSAIYRMGYHDAFIVLAVACSGAGGVGLVRTPLVAYRQHLGQTAGAKPRKSLAHRLRGSWAARKARPRPVLLPIIERFGQHAALRDQERSYLRQMLRHANARYTLPRQKLNRIPVITAELLSLRYHRFSNGFITAARDAIFVE
jgi:GT2 family glycosyltransferase